MLNQLSIFKNVEMDVEIRTIVKDGEVWFVGKDVAEALGISNSRDAISRLDDDEKADVVLTDGSQNRNFSIINESGLYSLVLSSRKPEAKKFKKWITSEVLPSIRKTGSYNAIQVPTTFREALLLAAEQQLIIEQQQIQLNTNAAWSTVLAYSVKLGLKIPVSEAATIGKALAKYCKMQGMKVKKADDPRYGQVNSYPIEALDWYFSMYKI